MTNRVVASLIAAITGASGCSRHWTSTDVSAKSSTSLFSYSWRWTDETGAPTQLSRWRGTPLVVTAMFTSCHDACPRTLARLHELDRQYQQEGRHVEFVLVTLDPETDTPDRLRAFKQEQRFSGSWHLLRGDVAESRQVAELLGMHLMDMDSHVIHDSRIMLFDGNGMAQVELTL